MRDKILKLMSLAISPLEKIAEAYVDEWRRAFEGGFGELPPDAAAALDAISEELKTQQAGVQERLIAVYEKYFTEEDLDAHIAWRQSAVNKKFESFSNTMNGDFVEILDAWKSSACKNREADLQRLLGMNQPAPAPAAEPAMTEIPPAA